MSASATVATFCNSISTNDILLTQLKLNKHENTCQSTRNHAVRNVSRTNQCSVCWPTHTQTGKAANKCEVDNVELLAYVAHWCATPLFAARWYAQARPKPSCGVCPSIRPSVCLSCCLSLTFVHCIKTNNRILNIFSPSSSHTILVFDAKPYGSIPTETRRGRRMQGMKKIAIFDQYFALSLKRYKIGHSYYKTPIGTCQRSIEWCHFQWPWMILAKISRSHHNWTLNVSETVRDRGVVTMDLHISNDFEWLSEMFNVTKHRTASLLQLSFLFSGHTAIPFYGVTISLWLIATHWLSLEDAATVVLEIVADAMARTEHDASSGHSHQLRARRQPTSLHLLTLSNSLKPLVGVMEIISMTRH